jgi:hypothetical protein
MKISDKQVKAVVVCCILVYLLTLFASEFILHTLFYLLFLNALSSALMIFYWVIRQLKITSHHFEMREMVVLALEFVAFIFSIYTMFTHPLTTTFIIVSYAIFTIHLLALLGFMIFVMTFKITKLF